MEDSPLYNSESDVEQKLIYKILSDPFPKGLGFSDDEILTKPNIRRIEIDKGSNRKLYYPDYVVLVNGLPILIVEAKAPNAEPISEAARQARLYATEINSSYKTNINPCSKILVCDGKKIVGYSWDSNDPIIELDCNGISPTSPEFDTFVLQFSQKSLKEISENIHKALKKNAKYLKPVYMLGGKSVIGESVGQNSFGANVSLEYKYLFNPDTEEDREAIVKNAYVRSKRKQTHVNQIDRVVRACMPSSVQDARAIDDSSNPLEVLSAITERNRRNEICLLIGSVGSGKSTFTDYLKAVALPSELTPNIQWVSINLNKAPLSRDLIYNWIIAATTKKIRENHQDIDFDEIAILEQIYKNELEALKKGRLSLIEQGSQKYIDILFQELEKLQDDNLKTLQSTVDLLYTRENKLLIIVLDNCDKRGREDQLLMFEVATWLKENIPCMIFLPLRDSTYDHYCNEPPLDTVIKDLVFRIDPPLLERVVQARLNYALRESESIQKSFNYYLKNNARVECSRQEVGYYLKSMVAALFQDSFFRRVITGLSGRNIRKGLEIFLDFCKSGHISEDLIFKIRSAGGDFQIPKSLIFRILLKGDRKYYSDADSKVKNLFFSEAEEVFPDPFVRIEILTWLKDRYREYGPSGVKGFHKVSSLLRDLQISGHNREVILNQINQLVEHNCMNAEVYDEETGENDLVSLSPSGFIHLDLIKDITYLSTVAEDTLFKDPIVSKKIADNITGRGKHKQWSRQSDISNSKALIKYMHDYYTEYFTVSTLLRESDQLHMIHELMAYVDSKAESDSLYQKTNQSIDKFPPGTHINAQVVSIQQYGVFVEFDLGYTGLIKKKGVVLNDDFFSTCEEGDWVTVEIITYNKTHEKFEAKLIEHTVYVS